MNSTKSFRAVHNAYLSRLGSEYELSVFSIDEDLVVFEDGKAVFEGSFSEAHAFINGYAKALTRMMEHIATYIP